MRSDRSSGNFSAALFIENIKRFWLLSFAGASILFLSAPFTIISEAHPSAVRDLLNSHNFGFLFIEGIMPVAAAVAVFGYLNNTGSVSLMHSMPFSRKALYLTNFFSGLALAELPFLLNALLVLILKKPVFSDHYDYVNGAEQYIRTDIFTYSAIAQWAAVAVLTIFFIYSVSVLGMIVSGNSVIGFLTAGAFNFLLAGLIMSGFAYSEMYLFGFSGEVEAFVQAAVSTNPLLYFPVNSWRTAPLLLFLAAALMLFILSGVLYSLRKLERAGESYVFRIMQHVVCFLLTFFAATLTGTMFKNINDINIPGLILGGIVGFVIARMIVKKTARIFNAESLRTMGVYAAVIALIVCCFAFDLFGYAARQPMSSDIESVVLYNNAVTLNPGANTVFRDAENIESIKRFHRQLFEEREEAGGIDHKNVRITYNLKNGGKIYRIYNVGYETVKNSADLRALYESSETKAMADRLMNLDVSRVKINIENSFGNEMIRENDYPETPEDDNANAYEISEDDISSLIRAYACDVNYRSYDEILDGAVTQATIYLGYKFEERPGSGVATQFHDYFGYSYYYASEKEEKGSDIPIEYVANFYLPVDRHFKNTLNWLKEHGLYDDLYSGLDDAFGILYAFGEQALDFEDNAYSGDGNLVPATTESHIYYEIPESSEDGIVVSDPERLGELYFDYSEGAGYSFSASGDHGLFRIMLPEAESWEKSGERYWYEYTEFYIDRNNVPDWLNKEIGTYFD